MPSTPRTRSYRYTMLPNDEVIVAAERTDLDDDSNYDAQESLASRPSRWMLIAEKWWYRSR